MPNENPPQCPNCGATMRLQTARKGKFAGQQFYGCPNWRTTCKGVIVNIDSSDADEATSIETEKTIVGQSILLNARERFENSRSLFYQNIAVPNEVIDRINNGSITREQVAFFGQWRIDYPESIVTAVPENIRLVLLVAKKILTRGRITLLSPTLEKALRKIFPPRFDDSEIDFSRYLGLIKPQQNTSAWFDGKPSPNFNGKKCEQYFYEDVLSECFGPYYKKFVLPQVQFSSLAGKQVEDSPTAYQRVDFLITTQKKSFVVELDDPDHEEHESRDDDRKTVLKKNGFETIRILNEVLTKTSGENLQELKKSVEGSKVDAIKTLSANDKYLLATKLAHQFQLSALEALLAGVIPLNQEKTHLYFDADSVSLPLKKTEAVIKSSFSDLQTLLNNLCSLYEIKYDFGHITAAAISVTEKIEEPIITFNENQAVKGPRFVIQDISFPFTIAHNQESIGKIPIVNPGQKALEYFLYYIFRFDTFLEGQFEAIERALQGKDAVILLPTGAGKSIAFQLASLLLPGVTIVIDPITALIDDQKENLYRSGIDRVEGITSQTEGHIRSQLIQAFSRGEYIFCYIAPERLQSDEFRNNLRALTVNLPISLIAIDEAHCVSEWGHDFRTAYLNIGRTTREYCKSHGRIPPLLALTGTASNAVLRDVLRELQIKDFEAIITPKTFDRKELHFGIFECKSDQKNNILRSVFQQFLPNTLHSSFNTFYRLQNENTNCGIVFCPHKSGSYGVIENASMLSTLGIESKFYSGGKPKGLPAGEDWTQLKRKSASDFKNNKFPVLVATKSFGMGIDKPNIRYTVHIGLPGSIESFYQEAGRAGRDRKDAQSVLILSNDFKERTKNILRPDATIDDLHRIMAEERNWDNDDDVTRTLYFHLNAFRGVEKELEDIQNIINEIGSFDIARKVNLVFPRGKRNQLEKSVHRLLLLGVINDYTIDYTTNEFRIRIPGATKDVVIEQFCRYVEGYNRGRVAQERAKLLALMELPFASFIRGAAQILINFVYDTIEKGRRRAFREMLSMSEEAASTGDGQDSLIRDRILRYLETTYSEEIQQVLDDVGTFENLKIIFDGGVKAESGEMIGGVRSPHDAAEIRGQVARYLESYPDHPGLLLLRALSEIYCTNSDIEIAFQNIRAACDFASSRYQISNRTLYDILTWLLEKIYIRNKLVYNDFVVRLFELIPNRDFSKNLLSYPVIDEEMLLVPAVYVFNGISKKAVQIINS